MPEALAGVLTGALARARAQAGALAAAAALLLLVATLTATSAHLLTGGQDTALAAALATAPADEVRAVARLGLAEGTTGPEQQRVLDDTAATLAAGAAPAPAERSAVWSSSARYLDPPGSRSEGRRDLDSGTLATLGSFRSEDGGEDEGDDDGGATAAGLADHAELVTGRWPAPPTGGGGALEVVVPEAATDVLAVGATAVLTPAPADESADGPLTAVVVGSYRPAAGDPLWQLEPLRGAGTTPAADLPGTTGRVQRPAVGPLLVDPGALAAGAPSAPSAPSALTAATAGAVVVPLLDDLAPDQARELAARVARAPSPTAALRDALGERVSSSAVSAALPRVLERAATEQRTAGAGLLVAAAAGAGAALAALAAVAELLADRRREESALLAARGASARQQLLRDAAEVVPLALLAVLLAVPASALAARALLSASLSASLGAAVPTGGGPWLRGAALVVAGVTGLAAVVVVLLVLARARAARGDGAPGRSARTPLRGPIARSGADVLLLGVAAGATWQLRAEGAATSSTATTSTGVVLVVAPALALLASALLGLRVLGLLRRAGERSARRSTGAPRAVAGWALARGPLAGATAALVVLSAATATTALAWRGAWSASTAQQVSAAQGADVVVEVPPGDDDGGVGALRTAAALATATGSGPTPVAVLPVALGTRYGAGPVSLVAAPVQSGDLAGPALTGPVLPAGAVRLVVTGQGAAEGALAGSVAVPDLRVAPSLVVRDAWGTLAVLEGEPAVLDGEPHEVAVTAPGATSGLQVVGAWLRVLPSADAGPDDPLADVEQRVQVRLDLPETPFSGASEAVPGSTAEWSTTVGGDGTDGTVSSTAAQLERGTGGAGAAVVVRALVRPVGLPLSGAALRVQAVAPPEALPVLVSAELAEQVGARPGQEVALGVGRLQVVAQVVEVVPVVPAAPGVPALQADPTALDAALLAGGVVPAPDRWWLGGPGGLDPAQQRAASAAVEASGLGTPTGLHEATAAAQHAPLAAALRVGWALLLLAAVAAALAGPALQVAAAAPDDALTSARLAVLGVVRRERVRAVVAPRAAQLLLGLLVGAAAGLVVAVAVVPALVRAPGGGPAVPRVDAALVLRAALTGVPALQVAAVLLVLVLLAAVPVLVAGLAASRRSGTA